MRRAGGRPDSVAQRERRGPESVGVVLKQAEDLVRCVQIARCGDIRLNERLDSSLGGRCPARRIERQPDSLGVAQRHPKLMFERGLYSRRRRRYRQTGHAHSCDEQERDRALENRVTKEVHILNCAPAGVQGLATT